MDLANHYIVHTLHTAAAERGADAFAAIADEDADDERLDAPKERRHRFSSLWASPRFAH